MTRFEISVIELYGWPDHMVLIPRDSSVSATRAISRARIGPTTIYVRLQGAPVRVFAGQRFTVRQMKGRISV